MVRRVTIHKARTIDGELLPVITIYETGVTKEQIKRLNKYTKQHFLLVQNENSYEMR